MKFTIDRTKWLRGEGPGASCLLRPEDGKMCCIGQVCLQLGTSPERISDRTGVLSVEDSAVDMFRHGTSLAKCFVNLAYDVNDSKTITDAEREARLKEVFSDGGHEIEFVN